MATCKHCGRIIEYRTTLHGRAMPVDPQRVAIVTPRGTVVHGWVSHFCTCDRPMRYLPGEITVRQRRFVLT